MQQTPSNFLSNYQIIFPDYNEICFTKIWHFYDRFSNILGTFAIDFPTF
jgi:hypothetical protein